MVLLAVLQVSRQGEDAYGVPVVDELERRSGRSVARASVYVTLRRMEEKGLVRSWLEEEASGRPRRFVEVTPRGMELLGEGRRTLLTMWEGLEPLLEGS